MTVKSHWLTLSNGEEIKSRHVVLAVGHSARDTFEVTHERGVYMEAKPFSVGFRIEHLSKRWSMKLASVKTQVILS